MAGNVSAENSEEDDYDKVATSHMDDETSENKQVWLQSWKILFRFC